MDYLEEINEADKLSEIIEQMREAAVNDYVFRKRLINQRILVDNFYTYDN